MINCQTVEQYSWIKECELQTGEAAVGAMGKRRSPGEGRGLLLAAARETFAKRGYAGTTTREVADRAGIAETLLFRNFGSKASLFSEVVVDLVDSFAAEWTEHLAQIEGWSDDQITREFVGRLYGFFCENRGLVLTWIAASVFEPELIHLDQGAALIDALEAAVDWGKGQPKEARKVAPLNTVVANRAVIGTVLSQALLNVWLHSEPSVSRAALVDGLTDFILYGADGPGELSAGA